MSPLVMSAFLMMGQAADPKLGETLAKLKDGDAKARQQAVAALATSKVELEPRAIAALAKVLDDADAKVRKTAAQTLGEIGPRAREWGGGPKLSAQLANLFKDKEPSIRKTAVWAYGQVGIDSIAELQPVYDSFKDSSPDVRMTAVASAAQYIHDQVSAEERTEILDRICDVLSDKDDRVKKAAGELLLKSGVEAVPGLKRMVENAKGQPRLWAALVLGEIGPPAKDAVPSLEKALGEVAPEGRPIVQAALKKIGS